MKRPHIAVQVTIMNELFQILMVYYIQILTNVRLDIIAVTRRALTSRAVTDARVTAALRSMPISLTVQVGRMLGAIDPGLQLYRFLLSVHVTFSAL
jgi:hypothetical protein